MVEIKIPFLPPTTNEQIKMNRANKFSSNIKKIKIERDIVFYLTGQKIPKFKNKIYIDIEFYLTNFNRDSDNVIGSMKYILDAMQKAGYIENDNLNQVEIRNIQYFKVPRKEGNSVILKIEEADDR